MTVEDLEKENIELKTKIEKMKNSMNCQTWNEWQCPYARNNEKKYVHPTQKPLELMKYLVLTYSNIGDMVLDSCMGSGTTGVACKELNRDFIGIEIDKKYFDIASERMV